MIRAVARLLRSRSRPRPSSLLVAAALRPAAAAARGRRRVPADAGVVAPPRLAGAAAAGPGVAPRRSSPARACRSTRAGCSRTTTRGATGGSTATTSGATRSPACPRARLLESRGLSPLRALPVTNAVLVRPRARRGRVPALDGLPPARARRPAAPLPGPRLPDVAAPRGLLVRPRHAGPRPRRARTARRRPSSPRALASLQNPPLVLLVGAPVGRGGARRVAKTKRRDGRSRRRSRPLPALLPAAFFQWQFGVFNLSVRPARGGAEPLRPSGARPRDRPEPRPPPARARSRSSSPSAARSARCGGVKAAPALLVFVLLPAPRLRLHRERQLEQRHVRPEPLRRLDAADPRVRGRRRDRRSAPRARSGAPRPGRSLSRSPRRRPPSSPGAGPLARSDFLEHSWAARLVLDHRPALYRPAPEVFVERTLHHEGPFEGPVVYRDASGRCRKAWLQWRHAEALVARAASRRARRRERLRAHAGQRETKRDWTYVDY